MLDRAEIRYQLRIARQIAPPDMIRLIDLGLEIEKELDLLMPLMDKNIVPMKTMVIDLKMKLDSLIKEYMGFIAHNEPSRKTEVQQSFQKLYGEILSRENKNKIESAYQTRRPASIFSYFITTYIETYSVIIDTLISAIAESQNHYKKYFLNNSISRVGLFPSFEEEGGDVEFVKQGKG